MMRPQYGPGTRNRAELTTTVRLTVKVGRIDPATRVGRPAPEDAK